MRNTVLIISTALLACICLFFFISGPPSHGPQSLSIKAAGGMDLLYDWERQRCEEWDIPDAPLRAFRNKEGHVVAFASDSANRPFVGSSFENLTHRCDTTLGSKKLSDPAQFSDSVFVTSFWTEDGTTVHALVHAEYHAERYKDRCIYKISMKCWYNAILYAKSEDGGLSFSTSEPPQIVAALPIRQDVEQGRHRGFFNPSNIIKWRDNWYMYAHTTGVGTQRSGVCLFRTSTIDDPASWRMFDGEWFEGKTIDPYRQKAEDYRPCKPIRGMPPVASIVRHKRSGLFIAVFQNPTKERPDGEISYSVSEDLVNWSPFKPLYVGPGMGSKNCADTYRFDYPSLMDPDAAGANFDEAGDKAELFMTRFRVENCQMGPRRDLVRIPMTIQ